jgi:hypothetical protein
MPWVGFKPTIPEFERAKMVHASDRAATVMGNIMDLTALKILWQMYWPLRYFTCNLRLVNSVTPFTLCNKVVIQVSLRNGDGGGDDDREEYVLLETIFSDRQSRRCEELHLTYRFQFRNYSSSISWNILAKKCHRSVNLSAINKYAHLLIYN